MAKTKTAEADPAAPVKKTTQREAVTQALAAGKESPPDGVKFVKDTFGMEMTNGNFSTLKSQIKKAAGTTTPARKPGRPAASANGSAKAGGISSGGKTANAAELARSVKALVTQYGAEAVTDMTKVFAD
jgi:hypothetical protein